MTKENDMAKNTKTIAAAVLESQASSAANEGKAVQAAATEEPKVGKVEARLAALEAYVKANIKALGWPEFEG